MSGSNVVRLVPNTQGQRAAKAAKPAPAARTDAQRKQSPDGGVTAIHDRYMLNDRQKLADALALAQCGLGLRGVQILTNYPVSFLSQVFATIGLKAQSGRRKTCLADVIRNPMFHASLGHFVATLSSLMSRNAGKLDARVFATAVRMHCVSTHRSVVQIHPDLLFAAACSFNDGTTTIRFCPTCRSNYAHITDPSSLVNGNAYGCPCCREMGALVGGVGTKARKRTELAPASIADLNICKPIARFPSQSPPKPVVQTTLRMLLS